MADDLCRKPMAFIEVAQWWWVHAASMSHRAGAVQAMS
jgi:hypothetical protein